MGEIGQFEVIQVCQRVVKDALYADKGFPNNSSVVQEDSFYLIALCRVELVMERADRRLGYLLAE